MKVTAERVREVLAYDPETGVFTWRIHRASNARAGDVAGTSDNGYIKIWIDGRQYRAHRLAWLYVHGVWPAHEIDHINRDKTDTRIANLRPVTRKQNCENQSALRPNTSGHRGVSWNTRQREWIAQIKHKRQGYHLGGFDRLEDAIAARLRAEARLFTHSEVTNV